MTIATTIRGRLQAAPLCIESAFLAARFDYRIKRQGFESARKLAVDLARRGRPVATPPSRIVRLVDRTCQLLHRSCLPRSLTLLVLLERAGVEPVLRIGAAPRQQSERPSAALNAHAWVELNGLAVGENVEGFVAFTIPSAAAVGQPAEAVAR